jgi:lysylphosphatidylglycerol synthetase-like protein (DUF2156 family)
VLQIPRSIRLQPDRLAATLAVTCGLANLLAAALPARTASLGRLDVIVPGPLRSGPAAAKLAVGLGLLTLAAGFWSRHPATLPIASVALAASAAWHLRLGSGLAEAALEAFLAGFLLARHDQWPGRQRRVQPDR